MRNPLAAVVLTAILAWAPAAMAHHSVTAEFDSSQRITFTGTVARIEWTNPHIFFYVDSKDAKSGHITQWVCELGSPNSLMGRGVTRDTLKVGMVVTLDGSLARDGTKKINARDITVDGKALFNANTNRSSAQ